MPELRERNTASVSVIIPVYNAAETLGRCIESVLSQKVQPSELIIVDDNSLDESVKIALEFEGITLISTERNAGPAVARNLGADKACEEFLLFIDADVVIPADTVHRIWSDFRDDETLVAVQALYSPVCPAEDSVSRYQNFYYFYYMSRCSSADAAIFSTYCAAVRSDVFRSLGGFNVSIPKPTVEDEEFGYLLADRGYRILLDKSIEVDHLAKYTLSQFAKRRTRMSTAQIKNGLRKIKSRLLRRYASPTSSGTHHNPVVLFSIFLVWAAIILFLFSIPVPAAGSGWRVITLCTGGIALLLVMLLNMPFLVAAKKEMGIRTAVRFAGLIFIDMIALGTGIFVGIAVFIAGRKY